MEIQMPALPFILQLENIFVRYENEIRILNLL